ncbi:hypothetical protein V8V71_09220 [Priestia megaterium]
MVSVPVYDLSAVTDNRLRIKLNNKIACFQLKAPDTTTPLRIRTKDGIKGIDLTVQSNTTNLIDFATAVKQGNSATIVENTTDYYRVTSQANADGMTLTLKNIEPSKAYTFNGEIELLSNVDDRLSIRVYNKTQNKYITTNVVQSTTALNTRQLLTGSFNTGALMVAGDVIELRIVQTWSNSTADAFDFKIYKPTLFIN